MALNGTGIEFGKSEHVFRWRISRATTVSADFIVLGQRCGQQVLREKVGHKSRAALLLSAQRGSHQTRPSGWRSGSQQVLRHYSAER
jgi:hypothetical protein